MSDWQKVRVTFNDADGNEVSAVMWKHKRDECEVFSHTETSGPDLWIEWNRDYESLAVTPIRELPTGVGAVIRVTEYNDGMDTATGGNDDVYVRTAGRFWTDLEGSLADPEDIDGWEYEILSEGIQIGDVK